MPFHFTNNSRIAIFALLATNFFWASNAVLARLFRDNISAFDLNFFRWFVALIILTPFVWQHLKKDYRILWQHKWQIVLLGILGVSFFNFALYQSVHTTQVINIGLFNSMGPLFTVILSILILQHRPNKYDWFSLICAMVGALVIIFQGSIENLENFHFQTGDLLMFFACFVWGIYTVLIKKWHIQIHPLSLLWGTACGGVLVLFLIMPFWYNSDIAVALKMDNWLLILYTAIFPALLAFLFWSYGIKTLGPPLGSLFLYSNPCFVAILSLFFLDESLQLFHLWGAILILLGLLATAYSKLRKPAF